MKLKIQLLSCMGHIGQVATVLDSVGFMRWCLLILWLARALVSF